MELMIHTIMCDVDIVTCERVYLVILIHWCSRAPCPRTPIPVLCMLLCNKVCSERLSTTTLYQMIVWCKFITMLALFARFCSLVLMWRCQLEPLRASIFLWGALAQFADSCVARAWESARGINKTPFTQRTMIASDTTTTWRAQRSKAPNKVDPQSQPNWMTTCLDWRHLKYMSSVDEI